MNTKHTPGPWKHTTPQGAFGHEIIGPDGHLICKMQHHPDEQKQAADDADLIAAAPDLLAALETIANQCGPFTVHGLPPLDYATIGNIARAAIAEATAQGFAPDGRK